MTASLNEAMKYITPWPPYDTLMVSRTGQLNFAQRTSYFAKTFSCCCCDTHPLWHIISNVELPTAIKQNKFQLNNENHG